MIDIVVSYSPGFDDLMLGEIQREHPSVVWGGELVPGVGVLHADMPFPQFAAPWMARLPMYIHHMFPRQVRQPLAGTRADLDTLRETVRTRIQPYEGYILSVQTRLLADEHGSRLPDAAERLAAVPYTPRDVASTLRPVFEAQGVRLKRQGEQVLSVVITEEVAGHVGLSMVGQNVSPWPGGRLPVYADLPSRAGKKLVEALATFDLPLAEGARALDLGAAPGGWTQILAERGLHVTAVDQAEMDPYVLRHPLVTWRRRSAEEYLNADDGPFDLIVNDIIMDAQDSARLMVDYAPMLVAGGALLMTLKLRSSKRRRVMDHSFRILRRAYDVIHVRQLYYNRHEVTLLLRRK